MTCLRENSHYWPPKLLQMGQWRHSSEILYYFEPEFDEPFALIYLFMDLINFFSLLTGGQVKRPHWAHLLCWTRMWRKQRNCRFITLLFLPLLADGVFPIRWKRVRYSLFTWEHSWRDAREKEHAGKFAALEEAGEKNSKHAQMFNYRCVWSWP